MPGRSVPPTARLPRSPVFPAASAASGFLSPPNSGVRRRDLGLPILKDRAKRHASKNQSALLHIDIEGRCHIVSVVYPTVDAHVARRAADVVLGVELPLRCIVISARHYNDPVGLTF